MINLTIVYSVRSKRYILFGGIKCDERLPRA